jgi:hypothetical protein
VLTERKYFIFGQLKTRSHRFKTKPWAALPHRRMLRVGAALLPHRQHSLARPQQVLL